MHQDLIIEARQRFFKLHMDGAKFIFRVFNQLLEKIDSKSGNYTALEQILGDLYGKRHEGYRGIPVDKYRKILPLLESHIIALTQRIV